MAPPALLQLSGVTLGFGGAPVLDGVDLVIAAGERLALVGRNGSGKSTLLRLIAGQVEPDAGSRSAAPGLSVAWMEQDPDLAAHRTLGDFAAAGLAETERWRVAMAAEGLGFHPQTPVEAASGGERRRAALARALATDPDLLLLDEPTNHLDIAAIRWLEARLADSRAAVVLISHDRAFLHAIARATLWLDRGVLRRREGGFEGFEAWREETWAAEDVARHKLDRRIRAEARWAVEGISARRRRNQGRLRALAALRGERAAMLRRSGTAALALESGPVSGRLVIEADRVSKRFGDRVILRDLSLRVLRGDRVAILGPNGAGKTTLLRLLTGQIAPDAGSLRHGTGLSLAVLDQNRAALDPEATLWEVLTGDPAARVAGSSDHVMVRGTPRHVVGYLKDFLFDEVQARGPVKALSGGEKARLLLARIMARESNLLVLDEPTNDLDIETLDLLEEVLADYPGTVLIVSHDRDFIDRVATLSVVLPGDGRAVVHAGGWREAAASLPGPAPVPAAENPSRTARSAARPRSDARPRAHALTFSERRRLDQLPGRIADLESNLRKLSEALADPSLFATDQGRFGRLTAAAAQAQADLSAAEEEWLDLAARAEAEDAGGD
ncbi:MAG: ATP-binding cassette domain-containing protein [Rhodobacteraceae bacterium]|jgi:ATP-binding cassette subfamily F protein uup|nr:ATP-binding cassette domain-containing protein [Paracoccaceae bacterium]